MPVLCNNTPAGSKDVALWNILPRGVVFRGGQSDTTQTTLLRFAAATLLHYCAYSIETRSLSRPSSIQAMSERPSTFKAGY